MWYKITHFVKTAKDLYLQNSPTNYNLDLWGELFEKYLNESVEDKRVILKKWGETSRYTYVLI